MARRLSVAHLVNPAPPTPPNQIAPLDMDMATPSSPTAASTSALDEEAEKVRIAVRALGDMRSSRIPAGEPSSSYWNDPRSPGQFALARLPRTDNTCCSFVQYL